MNEKSKPKREMPNPRPETKRRKNEIIDKLSEGMTKRKIADWLVDRYEICDESAFRLIREALKDIQESTNDFDITDLRTEYIERINSWIEKAIEKNDMKTALKCQEMLNKINQLYVEKQEIDVSLKNLEFKFGDE